MPDTPSIALLRRLREWDMFSIPSGDNEYWTAEIDKILAVPDESGVAREMLHNLSSAIEKCFTPEEWEAAEKEVFDGGNQSLHAVIRLAVTNLRNLTDEQLREQAKQAWDERGRVFLEDAKIRTQMQVLMDGLLEITSYIEFMYVGVEGRIMTPKEILEYMVKQSREEEDKSDLIDRLVDALKMSRSKASEIDTIVSKALAIPDSQQ